MDVVKPAMTWRTIMLALVVLVFSTKASTQVYDAGMANTFSQLNGLVFSDIELENEKGELLNTAMLKGKTVYVDFWFTQCPPCLREIPYSRALQQFFSGDTNLVFLDVCIENIERKDAWKKMIADKQMPGIHLFYARNRPQKINLLRRYKIDNFPTYLILNNNLQVIGYDAPAPSQQGWVHWALYQATHNVNLADAIN